MLIVAGAADAADPVLGDVVVVVAAGTPVESLDKRDLEDIFLGRTSTFPDGRPAMPVDLREGTPAREAFYRVFLGQSPAKMKAHWSKIVFTGRGSPPREVSSAAARELIAGDGRAIGYLERALADSSVKIVEVQ